MQGCRRVTVAAFPLDQVSPLLLVHDRIAPSPTAVPHCTAQTPDCCVRLGTAESSAVCCFLCNFPSWVGKQWHVRPQARHNCGLPVHVRPSPPPLLRPEPACFRPIRVRVEHYQPLPSVNVSFSAVRAPLKPSVAGLLLFLMRRLPSLPLPMTSTRQDNGKHGRRSSFWRADWPASDSNITWSPRIG